jgi:anti-anti-sigma regulatory factor
VIDRHQVTDTLMSNLGESGVQQRGTSSPTSAMKGVRMTSQLWVLPVERSDGQPLTVRVAGVADAESSGYLRDQLTELVDPASGDVIMDLHGLLELSTPGVQVLIDLAEQLATAGRRLRLASGNDGSVPLGPVHDELRRLRKEVRDLRGQLRTRPLVARALGILQARYGLRDESAAHELLRDASQRHNLKMRSVASAVLAAPPPAAGERWFPGRVRRPAPEVGFLIRTEQGLSTFFNALIEVACASMATAMGSVQLVDPDQGGLRLERQRGFTDEFIDYFNHVDGDDTACGLALRLGVRVVVADVATDPIYAGRESGEALRDMGVRAVQATPIVANQVLGMISTYHEEAGRVPSPAETAELDRIAAEAGTWLHWHQRTVVLDALEDLHHNAR